MGVLLLMAEHYLVTENVVLFLIKLQFLYYKNANEDLSGRICKVAFFKEKIISSW